MTYALMPPASHRSIIYWLRGVDPETKTVDLKKAIYDRFPMQPQATYGFITNCGMFVDKVEALKIAIDANQVIASDRRELRTEDLWQSV